MSGIIDFHQYSPDFDIDAGALCLDFANTLDWHASEHPEERLNSYTDLVAWGFQAGLFSADEANALVRHGSARPEDAEAALADAITLRESIYRIFVAVSNGAVANGTVADGAVSDGAQPDPRDLAALSRFWQQAAQRLVLVVSRAGVDWVWRFAEDDLRRVLWHVTRSAVELLQSEQRERVGQCEDDRGCGFLFIDTSRNRSRRWCSMESCGNRAKANRHYARAKK